MSGTHDTYGTDAKPAMGFFTDTSLCIGCKACEVACKEWNNVPESPSGFTGMSYDNTIDLGADTWRHVAFIEQSKPVQVGVDGDGGLASLQEGEGLRWLMASDVCKHCTHAGCLDVCPTGALFRTEFGTVVVQEDICNGCGYCVSGCPYGVIDRRHGDGRASKCTLCYDRLRGGLEPACAKACPTKSIQFGPLDEPEVYGLPPDPVVPTRDLASTWKYAGMAASALVTAAVSVFLGRRGR